MSLPLPPSQDLVVVGVSGDLAQRKLLPALYELGRQGLLPQRGRIVGVAADDWDDEVLRARAREAVAAHARSGLDDGTFAAFAARLAYVPAGRGLAAIRPALECDRRLVYLAVPPSAVAELVEALGAADLATGTTLVVEKPFGHDLASARELNARLHAILPEECILRIDHYLGKETVQNLLVFRFGNSIFERLWNRDCIARVEITVAEAIGVEHRGAFYEETGALRDIVQNHLFQLLAVTAMEPPTSFAADALHAEKVKVLDAVHPPAPESDVVVGQYGPGTVDGTPVPGYRDEPGVSPTSSTETFAALRLGVDTWRWAGVPFVLRTGKRLARRQSSIVVVFHEAPLQLFRSVGVGYVDADRLVVRLQPDEGIALSFVAKPPGPAVATQSVRMDFSYSTSFHADPPDAYERLLHDALVGDRTLFIREDEVERGWAILDPVLRQRPEPILYPGGSWGPPAAQALAGAGGWHDVWVT